MRSALKSLAPVLGAAVLIAVGSSSPVSAEEHSDSARGTIKIEETEFVDGGDTPNEVKVGCDFSIDFFGMDEGTVPVTFTLMPPSGDGVVAQRTAQVEAAQGKELSGRLNVDLTDDLADVPPAQAEDFDYKVRVDAEVKSSEGNNSISKSAILFIICDTDSGVIGGEEGDGDTGAGGIVAGEEGDVPVGGVAAGDGGTAAATLATGQTAALLGGSALLGLSVLYRRRARDCA